VQVGDRGVPLNTEHTWRGAEKAASRGKDCDLNEVNGLGVPRCCVGELPRCSSCRRRTPGRTAAPQILAKWENK